MAKVDSVVRGGVTSVTMTFNRDELKYLCTILRHTGGHAATSLRGAADSIANALMEQGIFTEEYRTTDVKFYGPNNMGSGGIWFGSDPHRLTEPSRIDHCEDSDERLDEDNSPY